MLSVLPILALSVLAGQACAGTAGDGPPGEPPPTIRLSSARGETNPSLHLEIPDGLRRRFAAAVDSVDAVLARGGGGGDTVPVRAGLDDGAGGLPDEVAVALARPEAFWIELTEDSVSVVAADSLGVLHGLTRLADLVRSSDGGLPTGRILDWPGHRVRAAHFVARNVELGEARRIVDIARRARFNTLVVQLADGVDFPSMGEIPRRDAWPLEEFRAFLAYARQNGLRLVPELKLLTHQEKLFRGHYPDLMYNEYTYDPRQEDTYDRVFAIVDEVLEVTGSDVLHIGHDEVEGVGPGEQKVARVDALPADLFRKDVLRLHGYLSVRGVDTWMWGDMLVRPAEFPVMLARHLHGDRSYAALRGTLPADIVITDWHYADRQAEFPSAAAFVRAGHDVLGATWKHEFATEAFSRYVKGLGPKGRGMIATTWWHVQKDDWDVVEELLRMSGRHFWRPEGGATPDGEARGR